MNRYPMLAFALLAPLAACGSSSSASAATHGYGIGSFEKLRISGPFDVHVHVGGAPGARATGPQEAIDRLSVEQNGDTLVIKPLPGGWGGWPTGFHGKLVIDVTTPSLSGVAMTGSGDTSIDRVKGDRLDLALSGSGNLSVSAAEVGALSATITGSGDLSVAGHAREAVATLTGSGDLKAGQLASDDAQARLVGSGDLSLGARHSAKVQLSGSGDITITGPAACTVSQSGSGDVHCGHSSAD